MRLVAETYLAESATGRMCMRVLELATPRRATPHLHFQLLPDGVIEDLFEIASFLVGSNRFQ